MNNDNSPLRWAEFERVEIRVGTVVEAQIFAEARKPALKLHVDFGDLGIKKTSAQITKLYTPQEVLGKQIVAVVNFPPKQIGPIMSECLVLGVVGGDGDVTLLVPDKSVTNGLRIA